ncbi:unnamed protein product [Rotaria sp. Silwood2]|nr:unnamed protein product [Rotaria sp. Silwood2]CAF3117181.1 unnamed protein product [Rotaria sp. Silwood2]CAF3344267.1 unnamed protein product [Rotaria sp. Silwood2]CAF3425820.1 unnamed protein product [Rotaria sp. Silwood2]
MDAQSKAIAEHLKQHREKSNIRALFQAVENFKEDGGTRNTFHEALDSFAPGVFGESALDPSVPIRIFPYSDDAFELARKKSQKTNLESYGLLWCDQNMNSREDSRQTQIKLREVINFLATFQTSEECYSYIQEHTDRQFILIISGELGRELIPQIHMLTYIISIYIFCYTKSKHENWPEQYEKVILMHHTHDSKY